MSCYLSGHQSQLGDGSIFEHLPKYAAVGFEDARVLKRGKIPAAQEWGFYLQSVKFPSFMILGDD